MNRIIFCLLILVFNVLTSFGQNDRKLYEEGVILLNQKKYKNAVDKFTKAIKENENTTDYYLKRGIAYFELQDGQNSYNDFSSAIKKDYTLGEAYFYRANLLVSVSRFREAIDDLDMAIKYPPSDSLLYESYRVRGSARAMITDYKGAFNDAQKYLFVDSTSLYALNTMALAKNDLKEPEEAIKYLEKSLAYHPGDTVVFMNLGFVYISLEKWDSAYKYLNLAHNLNPKQSYTISNLSFVKMKLGDLQGALKDINRSIDLNPDNSWAYRNRGLIYNELNQSEKACEDFRTSIKKGFTDMYGNEVNELIHKFCNKK